MPVIYYVTIKPTEKENLFNIAWLNSETNAVTTFECAAEITPEEAKALWYKPQYQLTIGQKLFRFLDGHTHYFQQVLDRADKLGETLQLHLRACRQTADWPFELLAEDGTFLLPVKLHLVRNVGDWGKKKNILPDNRPLKLLFMASSALDVKPELDFEREEEALFHITEQLAIDMDVEDSGSLDGLRRQLEKEQYDVVHLSGHADIDNEKGPYFIMEGETGNMDKIFPDMLWENALIENPPRLLFLSGCRTGDNREAVSFASLLAENHNLPAVLGWGRAVTDAQAIHAEKFFYRELSRGKSILDAVKRARNELLKGFTMSSNQAWPLLRLFSSGVALNAIVKGKQRPQPKPRRMKHVYLKNSQVQVLTEGFVGRRRQLQTSLHVLKQDFYKVGVLLLGAGGLGKSCLAGKICERFNDFTLIIVHGKLNSITLEAALRDAFIMSQDEKGQQLLSQKMEMIEKLANLCATCFKERNYLLLLNDFEQNFEGADKGQPGALLPEAADLLKICLQYLHFSGKRTQMIITSRYDFSLALQGRDLVMERLDKVWLTSFQETEQRKKARELKNIFNHRDNMLMAQVVQASHGNPGLMEWLDLLVGQMAVAEEPELLEAVNGKLEDFIREHLLRELLQHGGHQLLHFLRWFSIYRRPVSDEGAGQMAEKAGLERWRELLQKGMGLSLIEYDQTHFSYRVTPLLREELLNSMAEHQAGHEAASAYYQKACDTPEQPDPSLVEELVFHSVGFGQKEARSIDMQKIPPSESPIDSKGKIMKVFISYSHGDKKFVNRLTRDLENAGVHVWVDEKKIKVGDSISRKIEEGISECDFFCLVISRHSINSKWVDREYRTALNGQLSPGTTPKILPLLIQNVELPKFLADTLYTDFSRGYAKALKKLFDAVKEE